MYFLHSMYLMYFWYLHRNSLPEDALRVALYKFLIWLKIPIYFQSEYCIYFPTLHSKQSCCSNSLFSRNLKELYEW